jgi:hypothetical protein
VPSLIPVRISNASRTPASGVRSDASSARVPRHVGAANRLLRLLRLGAVAGVSG